MRVSNYARGEGASEGRKEEAAGGGRGFARVRRHLKHAEIERDLRAAQGDLIVHL